MGTPLNWKFWTRWQKYQFHFQLFVVILSLINNYTRNYYGRLTPNYDPPFLYLSRTLIRNVGRNVGHNVEQAALKFLKIEYV